MTRSRQIWTSIVTSFALFMVTLDNLVVTTALPSIRVDLDASLSSLGWTVNAYTLAFAVLLLPAAALGDRLGRRRVFSIGLGLFTLASAAAALAPSAETLIAARALQGAGAAAVMPLSLTLLSEAFPAGKRGLALGIWSGVSGLGVALGPLIGGAVVEGISWHWIFWINVPVGIVLVPLAYRRLNESRGATRKLDLPGLALVGSGLFALTYGIVRAEDLGWTSGTVLGTLIGGLALLTAFVAWELRTDEPMLPMRFFKSRAFSATSGVSLSMYFGVFGSIFLLAQFFQTAQGYSPLEAGLRTLPWTGVTMIVAPLAGIFSDRIGSRPLMAGGLALQAGALAWLASVSTPDVAYGALVIPFVMAGAGMALVFAPAANAILSSVRTSEAGQASGATSTIREIGGVLGVSVLSTVFAGSGSYVSPQAFTDGLTAALWVGAAVLAAGVVAALLVPGHRAQAASAESVAAADQQALAEETLVAT
ncbi:DHA2 family efflux MFS transporter permease subunit [Conexibacter sp. JD483]|uniref:DHA2 family efflux MFS transporter permease subunit n=1 Tax=unclassified Conexibacter TaxID=2627773 RepID=UPI002715656B|nr:MULTISPECIES: DHA2 family efflux MFS transporter permease subunit [unclassified Conexibacter]MDO8186186.1 DHA2 family efflux MFS transporter permease subunit [Conexibacter sp. CPCC 205706]MDO8199747.1 DHA2 family efflux MFS transporter permease subunit [Conexibacter sp. CPCC 205762]MDR9368161.1 DHA2 family efflux MFS transporter permease subunit [Conexibacter sp. JD483]